MLAILFVIATALGEFAVIVAVVIRAVPLPFPALRSSLTLLAFFLVSRRHDVLPPLHSVVIPVAEGGGRGRGTEEKGQDRSSRLQALLLYILAAPAVSFLLKQ